MSETSTLHVVGGGLAGSEAAWQAAEAGVPVVLHEMRPQRTTPVHHTHRLAELVCSNSMRSDDWQGNAVGLLHAEMRRLASLVMACADATAVPAGGALAVDREAFAAAVQERIDAHPRITVERDEVAGLPPEAWDSVILATGPLTSDALAAAVQDLTGESALAFFDAMAPIVYAETIDFDVAWFQSRYDKGSGDDYVNCPLDKPTYDAFIDALLAADRTTPHGFDETPYFEGCLPVEVMAERGRETLAHGPMKPVGLTDPRTGERPHAVVQLRRDNQLGTLYNMVGFQTRLKHADQVAVFRMIPGLENASFARLGGLHRNTFLNSPRLLDPTLRLKAAPRLRFAGQITGCEGYVESAAVGLMAGRFAAAERHGEAPAAPPATTAHGALLNHITEGADPHHFQPMNINFGLFPPLPPQGGKRKVKGRERKARLAERALDDLEAWLTRQAQSS